MANGWLQRLTQLAFMLLVVLVSSGCQPTAAPPTLWIGPASVLEDQSGTLTLEQILQQRANFHRQRDPVPHYQNSIAAYWFHLPVQQRDTNQTRYYVNFQRAMIDEATLFVKRRDNCCEAIQAGHHLPSTERAMLATTSILPFTLAGGEKVDLYIRVRDHDGAFFLPYVLQDQATLDRQQRVEWIVNGAILGLFITLFAYNLLIFYLLRERAYLYYVLYLPFTYLSVATAVGFGSAILYPQHSWFAESGRQVVGSIAQLMLLQFTRAFLHTADHPRLDRLFRVMLLGCWGVIGISLLLPRTLISQVSALIMLCSPPICLGAGLLIWWRGQTAARFYLLGQMTSSLAMLAFAGLLIGWLPYCWFLNYSLPFGVSVDALLMSWALADRIRTLQAAKEAAENAALRHMELRQEELERLIGERTADLVAARQEAELLATTDALTGVYNRRGLFDYAQHALQQAKRLDHPFSLILFDLDHFKQINDTYGHPEGDRVLCAVAMTVRKIIRATDLIGRVGGEEFLIVMPNTLPTDAAKVAERIRYHLMDEVAVGEPPVPVTASFGIAWLDHPAHDFTTLLSTADAALYRAKGSGRNRIEYHLMPAAVSA